MGMMQVTTTRNVSHQPAEHGHDFHPLHTIYLCICSQAIAQNLFQKFICEVKPKVEDIAKIRAPTKPQPSISSILVMPLIEGHIYGIRILHIFFNNRQILQGMPPKLECSLRNSKACLTNSKKIMCYGMLSKYTKKILPYFYEQIKLCSMDGYSLV